MSGKYLRRQLAMLEIREGEFCRKETDTKESEFTKSGQGIGKSGDISAVDDSISIPIWRDAIKEALLFAPISFELRLALSVFPEEN